MSGYGTPLGSFASLENFGCSPDEQVCGRLLNRKKG